MKTIQPEYSKVDKKRGRGCALVMFFMIFMVALAVGSFFFIKSQYDKALEEPLSDSDQVVTFVIEEGEGVDSIITNLGRAGILNENQERYFKFYISSNNLGNTLQAGSFEIPKGLNMSELAQTLQSAGIPEAWVTFNEGLRMDEFADILEEEFANQQGAQFDKEFFMALTTDQEFINSLNLNGDPETLEGFLFPDKYLIPIESSEEEIIQMFIDNFNSKVSDYTYEDLIIASMLEREGRGEEERRMIADIINRRLAEGWFLGIDATLLYHYKDWERELTDVELKEDHPYNTRTRIGLPPTPIGNPGLQAIEATQNPMSNDYYYYIHDPEGQIYYAITYEEHNQNILNYIQ